MKTFLLLILLCLLATPALEAQTSTLFAVEENGTRGTQLNIVFLPDGYTDSQMGKFATDVQAAVDFLLTKEPWVRYRSYCNVYRIEIASNQSGTDNGADGGLRDTYFQSGFLTGPISRLNTITGTGQARAYALMNKHVPEYDIPVVLVNDTNYGGSGGPISVATTDEFSVGVIEHEIGHSFSDLADEYEDPTPGYSRLEFANATSKKTLAQVPWKDWIKTGTPLDTPEDDPAYFDEVAHFQGANYRPTGSYRPHHNALMRSLFRPPGSVARESLTLSIYKKVPLIDSLTPTSLTQTFTAPAPLTLSVTPKVPSTAPALTVEWRLNNVTISGETGSSLVRNTKDFGNGTHKIKAIVRDPTDWVRRDPTALVVEEVTWTLNLSNQTDPAVINTPLPASRVLEEGFSVFLDATATGPGPITYQWLRNNAPLNPAVTTPTLSLFDVTLAQAGTYTVKITNPGHTRTYSCVVAVLKPNVPRVVVAKGKTATLAFTGSTNLPPVSWFLGEGNISNGPHYANATTKALQIKNVDVGDSGDYNFNCGDYGPSPAVTLLVVTTKPDYTGLTPTLPTGVVGGQYSATLPMPADPLQTPTSFGGTVPAGLKLDPKAGTISGIPTVASKDQALGDEITFTIGNDFGKVPVKIRLKIKPLPSGMAGFYSGFVQLGSPLGGSTGGRIDLNVMSTGSYTGSAIIGAEKLPINGKLSVPHADSALANGTFTLKPKHTPAGVTVNFEINDAGDADDLTATAIANPGYFFAWRNKWLPPEAVDTFKGYHTFAFTVPAEPNAPKGRGFGSVTIDATGKTVVTGRLADGETFATTSHLDQNGLVLIYQGLYTTTTKGSFICLLDLDTGPSGPVFTVSSQAAWVRPPDTRPTARTYAAGFGPLDIGAVGGLYTPPGKTEIILGLPAATGSPLKNALLSFDKLLGDDPLSVDADVSLEIKPGGSTKVNTPNPKVVTFSVTPADGRFKGSYTTKDTDPRPTLTATPRPLVSRKVDYQGIIVNDGGTRYGYGFFLRDALPKADGSTTPTTSPKNAGSLLLRNSNL